MSDPKHSMAAALADMGEWPLQAVYGEYSQPRVPRHESWTTNINAYVDHLKAVESLKQAALDPEDMRQFLDAYTTS